ncbi:hypothetical protein AB1Y20_001355 [Prymnesium parvum]|uniref:AB hydrolase-1 domain-containing protein n=1 Tax=Prymnesium parvum TaxID=97485 RepID=A0AB34KAL9_PRYPA
MAARLLCAPFLLCAASPCVSRARPCVPRVTRRLVHAPPRLSPRAPPPLAKDLPPPERSRLGGFREELALEAVEAAAEAESARRVRNACFPSRGSAPGERGAAGEYSFRAAVEASKAYSWSLKTIESSQGAVADAYTWSRETALNLQTLGRERLQMFGLLPAWLSAPPPESGRADTEEGGLVALVMLVVLVLESVGPVALLLSSCSLVCLALGCSPASMLEAPATALTPALVGGAAGTLGMGELFSKLAFPIWLVCEAFFYLLCNIVSWIANRTSTLEAFGYDPRRRVLWKRILYDPSLSATEFVESWMYREAEVCSLPPHKLLFDWLLRRVAAGRGFLRKVTRSHIESVAPYGEVSRGDVYSFLCHNLYLKARCSDLSDYEDAELRQLVAELEQAAGKPLRHSYGDKMRCEAEPTTDGIRHLAANYEAVRWRHRPLLYYAASHGLIAGLITPLAMQREGFVRKRHCELHYWYRPSLRGETDEEAFVFIHGVGFGPLPYLSQVDRWAGGAAVVLVEIKAVTQRIGPAMPPSPDRFAELLDSALASLRVQRAVLTGHSLGSAFAWFAARRDGVRATRGVKRRYGGVVLIDPVACGLHHSRTSREFVYTRIENMRQSIEDYIFKKELWTTIANARHLPWHDAELWLDDCSPSVPTLLAVGTDDTIINPPRIAQAFGSWGARLRGVRVLTMPGVGHGGWLQDEGAACQLVAAVLALRQESASIGLAEAAVGSVRSAAGAAAQLRASELMSISLQDKMRPVNDQLKLLAQALPLLVRAYAESSEAPGRTQDSGGTAVLEAMKKSMGKAIAQGNTQALKVARASGQAVRRVQEALAQAAINLGIAP